jgi:hypothetical protein
MKKKSSKIKSTKAKFEVYDAGMSCTLGEYVRLSNANRRREKELTVRQLPRYCVVVREISTNQ